MRRAILHIGTEKTGTSTLQLFFAKNRAALARNGILYPQFAGDVQHSRLTAYAQDDRIRDDLRIDLGIESADDLAAFRTRVEAEAAAELGTAPATLLFSSEHLQSRLVRESELARLRAFLSAHVDRVEIAVYLRRQDLVAVSLYSTLVKFGGDREAIFPDLSKWRSYFDYAALLERWAAAFGRDAIRPRIFEPACLRGGSVVEDFATEWALGPGLRSVANANESVAPAAQEWLRRLNSAYPGYLKGKRNPMRGRLGDHIGALYPGKGLRPARAEAAAFLAEFDEINDRVRRDWFPDRAGLFDPDLSGYPEAGDRRSFTFEDAVEISVALWAETRRRELQLEYEVALRDGEIAELKGETDIARSAYARAAELIPARPEAPARLAQIEGHGRLGRLFR
ncbi:MAG: hypothetical protein ACFBSD_16690 [Paracoccaceae bacterium]